MNKLISDAWGNILSKTGTMADINPFRYRSYYYDTETGFYYLQTRYYDPEIRRFINADNYELIPTLAGTIGQLNVFAYANNDPIMYTDETGEFVLSLLVVTLAGALIGALIESSIECAIVAQSPAEPMLNPVDSKYQGQLIKFEFSKNPDYNLFTSFYYTDRLYEMGLPEGRTYAGIWLELNVHFIGHKFDMFDLLENDNVADMGSYKHDTNAYIWENIIQGIRSGLESWYYDKW